METVSNVDELLGRDMLAWVQYPYDRKDSACFLFPGYCIDGGALVPLDGLSLFPDIGNVVARVRGGYDSGAVHDRFGSVVVARVNDVEENPFYIGESRNRSMYAADLNMSAPSGRSSIEFMQFGQHSLANRILQVIEIDSLERLGEPPEGSLPFDCSTEVVTNNVLAVFHYRSGDRLVGPITCKTVPGKDLITLSGSSDYDYRVYEFPARVADGVMRLADNEGRPAMSFVDGKAIRREIASRGYIAQHDWLPKTMLVEAMNRAIGLSDDTRRYTKGMVRRIKRDIRAIADDAPFELDEGREGRILDIAGSSEYFGTLPSKLQDALFDSMSDERLGELVLADRNFPRFVEQLESVSKLRETIDERRAKLDSTLESRRGEIAKAEAELAKTNGELSAARSSLAELRHRAEEAKSEELERLEGECAARRAERDELEARVRELRESEEALEGQIEALMRMLDDKVELSSEVLRSQVVNRIAGIATGFEAPQPARPREESPREMSFGILSPEEGDRLVDRLVEVVANRSGRSYTRNDVINYYTCMSQSYITTFAGTPGTGKTSLCRLLADGMGLGDSEPGRFIEVSVERGWASFRDYIGYYNPLTRSEEMTNPEVFEAMERLTGEDGAEADSVPPCVFLLDEANLSPIEHYWASFLRACDSFSLKTTRVPIGGDRTLLVPRHVRFLATVNFDHTTEELSPRFLDRTFVVMLQPEDILGAEDVESSSGGSSLETVSYGAVMRTFGAGPGAPSIDAASEKVLGDALQACMSHRRPVSPRSQSMMRSFVSAATRLMDTRSVATRFDPVDFAISQKVLPAISGPRETCESLLEDLAAACSDLPRTTRHIERMLDMGNQNGYYQFFA